MSQKTNILYRIAFADASIAFVRMYTKNSGHLKYDYQLYDNYIP